MSDIEDLALDATGGRGVITILSDTLSWRTPQPYKDSASMDVEPWLDEDLYDTRHPIIRKVYSLFLTARE